jgi:hypothetical protein
MPLTMSLHYAWSAWKVHGWTEADLELVVRHIKNLIKQDRRRPESFRFNNLIMNTDRFMEDLVEAKAYARIPVKTPRDHALESIGRKEPVKENVRTPASILAADKALKQLLEFRDNL